jgi:CRISPR-associated protein Csb1
MNSSELLERWANQMDGPVALHFTQRLYPVDYEDGHGGIVYPATYANIGYNVDTLSNGTKVATIDSVGSQANRMEPLFKEDGPFSDFVPQVTIDIRDGTKVSLLDLAHRAADATVQSCGGLAELAADAFKALQQGDATKLCALAPTSLVFGVWDSRGETGEKRPRLVRSVVRAWDVEILHAAAQFNSVWKKLDAKQRDELEKEAKAKKVDLAEKGFKDAPAVFRKGTKAPQYANGAPNPEARVLGGVLVKDRIERDVVLNLVALRGLRGGNEAEANHVRRYLLGLGLLAATADLDSFLREGCMLRVADREDRWYEIPRRGDPVAVEAVPTVEEIKDFIQPSFAYFRNKWPQKLDYKFSMADAKKLLAKKATEEEAGE